MVHYVRPNVENVESQSGDSDVEPALLGELWDPKFERYLFPRFLYRSINQLASHSLAEPLFRLLVSLPQTSPSPLQPPLTYVLHCLMNVPVDASKISRWITQVHGVNVATGKPRKVDLTILALIICICFRPC